MRTRTASIAGGVIFATLVLLVLLALAQQPLATNDGPVHVAFSDLIANLGDPDRELQRDAYRVEVRVTPNLLPYLLMAFLIEVGSVRVAETVIQALCLIGPMAAGWLALRTIRRESAWLAIFIFPLSFNEMFFFGLYNYCLSTAFFFVVIAAYWWMKKAPSLGRSAWLGVALCLTLLTHAAGFVASWVGVGAMTAALLFQALRRGERIRSVLMHQRHALLALALPLPLLGAVLTSAANRPVIYGTDAWVRLLNAGRLLVLRIGGGVDSMVALALSVVLMGMCAWALARLIRSPRIFTSSQLDPMVATLAALGVSVLLLFVFPDTMGGGWTHARRFVLFPFFWVLILVAQQTLPALARLGALGFASLAAFALVGATMAREKTVRAQMAPLLQVDQLVGTHCTVLPIVLQGRPVDATGTPHPVSHNPYFQMASRLERHGDRVVLFNYLARLVNYPVKFRADVEPQEHLFHWLPQQVDTAVKTVDVEGFEKSSRLPLDYVLVVGEPMRQVAALRDQLQALIAPSQQIYKSSDERVALYLRPRKPNSRCVLPDAPPTTSVP